eukprot:2316029-Pleurochrysis_carterae.AAC.1
MRIRSKGKSDKHGPLREGENAPSPPAATVLVAGVRRPEAPGFVQRRAHLGSSARAQEGADAWAGCAEPGGR